MEEIELVDDLSNEMANQCRDLIKTKRMKTRDKEERYSMNQITEEAERLTESLKVCHNLAQHGSFFPLLSLELPAINFEVKTLMPTSGATSTPRKEIRHWEYDIHLKKRVPRM